MGLVEKLRDSKIFKIIVCIVLFIIILDGTVYNYIMNYLELNKEGYSNLKYSEFVSSENMPNNLGQIFKKAELNLNQYPNVEIKPGQQLFNDNKFLPECCMYYSDYSTDKGCPCITPEQQYHLQRRGGNRDKSNFVNEKNMKNVFFSPTNALKGKKEEVFIKHDIHYKKPDEALSEDKKKEVYSILHQQSR